jgi:hypothetical protein
MSVGSAVIGPQISSAGFFFPTMWLFQGSFGETGRNGPKIALDRTPAMLMAQIPLVGKGACIVGAEPGG